MTTMHIVDSTLFFAPHSGGVKRYLLEKSRYLASVPGIRHTLLVPGPNDSGSMPGIVQVSSPRVPFGGGYRLPLRPAQWRDALCRLQPDLIEVGDPYYLAWSALAAARQLRVPAIAFAHSHVSRMFASRFGNWAGATVDAYLQRLYAGFDLVLAPSRVVADHLLALGIEHVEVQSLGVDTEVFHPSAHSPNLRSLLCLPLETRLLVFAGRMAREKSIGLMCRAVEALGSPYHLLLVGARARRRVSSCVTELPYQQDARQLARLLASADALLHAGQQETFGLVILEAMACGRPVVAVAAGAVTELVDSGVGRLAETGDVESLQHAIRSLYDCDRDSMGACARQRVERSYSWQRALDAQLARYSRLIGLQRVETALVANHAPS